MDRKREAGRNASGQHARFVETARALGADEDEAAFKAKLAVIARQKPEAIKPSVTAKREGQKDG